VAARSFFLHCNPFCFSVFGVDVSPFPVPVLTIRVSVVASAHNAQNQTHQPHPYCQFEKSVGQLRDVLTLEMARTREEQNTVGELIMNKDAQIKELTEYKMVTEEILAKFERDDADMKTQSMTLEMHNKSLVSQVEALQVRLAGSAELELLTNDIRQTVSGERLMAEEIVQEKERNLNLELEIKDLQHKIDIMTASMREVRDVQGLSDEIRELVGSASDSAADLLAEKERSLAMQVESATLRREIELLQEQLQDREQLQVVLGEISNLGNNVDGARSLTENLLLEKERCSQLQVQNVSLQREMEMLQLQLQQYEDMNVLANDIRNNCLSSAGLTEELLSEKEKTRSLEVGVFMCLFVCVCACLRVCV